MKYVTIYPSLKKGYFHIAFSSDVVISDIFKVEFYYDLTAEEVAQLLGN